MAMTWNYRIIRYTNGDFGLHEVYYENGKPKARTQEAIVALDKEEGVEGIVKSLELMIHDAKHREILDDFA